MKTVLVILQFCLLSLLHAQSTYFPSPSDTVWQRISLKKAGFCKNKFSSVDSFLQASNSKAFILLKDGKIVYEKYYGSFTVDSNWYWASAGKTLTAYLTGIAQDRNLLSINDTVENYLGNWTNCTASEEAKRKIIHLLEMTSGFDDSTNPFCTEPQCLNCIAEPGKRWAYHNGPYTNLLSVIEEAYGDNINRFVFETLRPTIGLNGFFFKTGYNRLFISNPRSMARFGLLLLSNGKWKENTVLADTAYLNSISRPSQNLNRSYGYLTWLNGQKSFMLPSLQTSFPGPLLPNAPNDLYAAIGNNGQLINVVPSEGLVLIRIGNNPDNSLVPITFNDSIWVYLENARCETGIYAYKNGGFSVFPNPFKDEIVIQGIREKVDYQVFDLSGRLLQEGQTKGKINIIEIKKGSYILRVGNAYKRIIKQ